MYNIKEPMVQVVVVFNKTCLYIVKYISVINLIWTTFNLKAISLFSHCIGYLIEIVINLLKGDFFCLKGE